jgi:hypothetical protein
MVMIVEGKAAGEIRWPLTFIWVPKIRMYGELSLLEHTSSCLVLKHSYKFIFSCALQYINRTLVLLLAWTWPGFFSGEGGVRNKCLRITTELWVLVLQHRWHNKLRSFVGINIWCVSPTFQFRFFGGGRAEALGSGARRLACPAPHPLTMRAPIVSLA